MISEVNVKSFILVANYLSFTTAANKLFTTRQSISKHIMELEESLQTKLFVRSKSKVELTPEGMAYLKFFKDSMKKYEELRSKIQNGMKISKPIRIGYPRGLELDAALYRLINICIEKGYFNSVKWESEEPYELNRKLLCGELDVIFTYLANNARDKRLSKMIFKRSEIVLAVSRSNPKVKDGARYTDFADETVLYWQIPGISEKASMGFFMRSWKEAGLKANNIKLCANREAAWMHVEMGEGIILYDKDMTLCNSSMIATYPVNKSIDVICSWRKNGNDHGVYKLIEELRNAEQG